MSTIKSGLVLGINGYSAANVNQSCDNTPSLNNEIAVAQNTSQRSLYDLKHEAYCVGQTYNDILATYNKVCTSYQDAAGGLNLVNLRNAPQRDPKTWASLEDLAKNAFPVSSEDIARVNAPCPFEIGNILQSKITHDFYIVSCNHHEELFLVNICTGFLRDAIHFDETYWAHFTCVAKNYKEHAHLQAVEILGVIGNNPDSLLFEDERCNADAETFEEREAKAAQKNCVESRVEFRKWLAGRE